MSRRPALALALAVAATVLSPVAAAATPPASGCTGAAPVVLEPESIAAAPREAVTVAGSLTNCGGARSVYVTVSLEVDPDPVEGSGCPTDASYGFTLRLRPGATWSGQVTQRAPECAGTYVLTLAASASSTAAAFGQDSVTLTVA